MTNALIIEKLNANFADKISHAAEQSGIFGIEVEASALKAVVTFLKNSELNFMFLTDICAVHFPEKTGQEFQIVYHLHNLIDNKRLRLKANLSQNNIEIDSLSDLYAGANWMERETYDFYGVKFKNHPDLRPILNMEDLGYHPLRKEYRLEDETRTDKNDAMFGR
jgi:NADH/F420H2 dehydrogenase subunit C